MSNLYSIEQPVRDMMPYLKQCQERIARARKEFDFDALTKLYLIEARMRKEILDTSQHRAKRHLMPRLPSP